MTRPDPTEDRIRTWLHTEASGELPDWVLHQTFDQTRTAPQQRAAPRRHHSGRSHLMMNAARLVAVVAVVTVGAWLTFDQPSSAPVSSGPSPSPSPVAASPAASPEPAKAGAVTGAFTYDGDQVAAPTIVTDENGVAHYRGERWTGIGVDSTDPRLVGTANFGYDRDVHPGGGGVIWGTTEIITDEGSWTGRNFGPIMPADTFSWSGALRLTGSGAYEGWSAILMAEPGGAFAGVILSGPLPTDL